MVEKSRSSHGAVFCAEIRPGLESRAVKRFFLFVLSACCFTAPVAANPCIDTYRRLAGEVLTSPAGRVAKVEPITNWFEDGVYRVSLDGGGVFMTRPGGADLPDVGATIELRVYSKTRTDMPMAGCYCETGTNTCVEEYSYP